jgi:gas vesicle protein
MKEIMYFLMGLAFGAVIGLMFAPKSGAELRADLQTTAERDLAKWQTEWQAAMVKTHERLDQMQVDLKQALEQAPSEEGEAA